MKTLAFALTSLVLASGCGSDDGSALGPPSGDPNYSGAVVQVDGTTVLVQAAGDTCGIWARTDDSVRVLTASGDGYVTGSLDDLEPGIAVDLWIPGPIAESCPMQGTAEAVVVTAPA